MSRDCERAKDGRGLVAALGGLFSVGGAGTEPPNSLTPAFWVAFLGGGGWGRPQKEFKVLSWRGLVYGGYVGNVSKSGFLRFLPLSAIDVYGRHLELLTTPIDVYGMHLELPTAPIDMYGRHLEYEMALIDVYGRHLKYGMAFIHVYGYGSNVLDGQILGHFGWHIYFSVYLRLDKTRYINGIPTHFDTS